MRPWRGAARARRAATTRPSTRPLLPRPAAALAREDWPWALPQDAVALQGGGTAGLTCAGAAGWRLCLFAPGNASWASASMCPGPRPFPRSMVGRPLLAEKHDVLPPCTHSATQEMGRLPQRPLLTSLPRAGGFAVALWLGSSTPSVPTRMFFLPTVALCPLLHS